MRQTYPATLLSLGVLALLAACSEPDQTPAPPPAKAAAAMAPQTPVPSPVVQINAPDPVQPAVPGSSNPAAQAIDTAVFPEQPPSAAAPPKPTAGSPEAQAQRNRLIRAEVLLDRARFSPGVIDGQEGTNLRLALSAYQQSANLPVTGQLDVATLTALTAADSAPVMQDYQITDADAAGPFAPSVKEDDFTAMAKLDHLGYATPLEALAEKFHMDEGLLSALNPGADLSKAGTTIVVVAPRMTRLAPVTAIEVDKAKGQVRAYGDNHALLAVFPATVGSTERPAPSGQWAVRAVAPRPTYTFDPSRLTFGKYKKKLTIAAGPNNPVGAAWIDLTKDTYGIHGTPDPKVVNKRASHGCVRLTNWDVLDLASAVKKGASVDFVGVETRAKT